MTHLHILPDIRLWIDDAHVRLIGTSIYQQTIIQLKECVSRVILDIDSNELELGMETKNLN